MISSIIQTLFLQIKIQSYMSKYLGFAHRRNQAKTISKIKVFMVSIKSRP